VKSLESGFFISLLSLPHSLNLKLRVDRQTNKLTHFLALWIGKGWIWLGQLQPIVVDAWVSPRIAVQSTCTGTIPVQTYD
jgi:hypothetical protein